MGTGTVNSKKRYLASLKTTHRELDKQITEMYNKHQDDLDIKALKMKKLETKTKISQIENELSET